MYPRVAIAGTEQLVRLARPNDGPAAFDGGPIYLHPKAPLAVHDDLQDIMHVLSVGGATAHIQKVTGPKITTVFGNLFFHNLRIKESESREPLNKSLLLPTGEGRDEGDLKNQALAIV